MSRNRVLVCALVLCGTILMLYGVSERILDGRSAATGTWLGSGDAGETERGIVPQSGVRVPVQKSTAGVGEDPNGRAFFEWMRLHEPATGRIPPRIRSRELSFAKMLPTREFLSLGKNSKPPLEWTTRGPIQIGGRTRALGIDRDDENILNAGGVSGGMWHSEDDGATWAKTTRPDQHHSVTTLIQDPREGQSNVWYYGSGEFIGNSASAPNTPYLGTGMYRSTDNGRSWEEVPAFAQAGDDPRFTFAFEAFYNLAINPSNTSQLELYAATFGLIYRYDGETREPQIHNEGDEFASFTDVAVTDDGVVYAALSSDGTNGGLWQLTDGENWQTIRPPGWPSRFDRTVIAIAPSNQNLVYFLSETPGTGETGHSLWLFNAEDNTWSDRTANLPTAEQFPVQNDNFPEELGAFDSQNGYDLVIAVKPDDPNVVFIGGTNLYRSTDGFATPDNTDWIGGYDPKCFIYGRGDCPGQEHHPDQHAIVFYPSDPTLMLTGSDGGVHGTTDNLRSEVLWTDLNAGYRTTQFYSVAVDESDPGSDIIVGGMQDNGTVYTNRATGDEPWIGDILGGDGSFVDIADGQEYFYVSAQEAQIFRLEIEEGVVTSFARVDPTEEEVETGLFITPFHLDPNDQAKMYLGGGEDLWRNENLLAIPDGNQEETNTNWTRLENTGREGDVVTAVKPVATTLLSTRVYYATFNSSGSPSRSRILRLEDAQSGQPTPVDLTQRSGAAPMPDSAYVSSIAVDPADPSNVMITFSNYGVRSVFYSDDAGETWSHVSGNLEDEEAGGGSGPSTRWADILPVNGGTMYFVGASTGLYSTTSLDGVNTMWIQEGASTIGNVVVDMVDVRPGDNLVVAATHGNGIYSATASVDLSADIPLGPGEAYALSGAYPNPFTRSARFTLRVAHEQHVEVGLYDQLGRRVTLLFDGRLPGNSGHTFEVDAGMLANGVYTYRAVGERFTASRQVVLMR